MDSLNLTASVTVLANSIACRLSDDELNLAAAYFTQLGDTLATISVSRDICGKFSEKAGKN